MSLKLFHTWINIKGFSRGDVDKQFRFLFTLGPRNPSSPGSPTSPGSPYKQAKTCFIYLYFKLCLLFFVKQFCRYWDSLPFPRPSPSLLSLSIIPATHLVHSIILQHQVQVQHSAAHVYHGIVDVKALFLMWWRDKWAHPYLTWITHAHWDCAF